GSGSGGVDVNLFPCEVSDEIVTCFATVRAASDDDNHVIHVIQRDLVAFKNVLALFGLHQQVRSPSTHHVHAMIDEVLDGLDQPHLLGLCIPHGQQDHPEASLHLRVFV